MKHFYRSFWLAYSLLPALALGVLVPMGLSPSRALADDVPRAEPVIVIRQTGGFAGIDEVTTIWTDGRVERTRNAPSFDQSLKQLAGGAEEASALRSAIEATGLQDLPADTGGITPCCDRITTTLTLMFLIPPREFRTFDGGAARPAMSDSLRLVQDAIQTAVLPTTANAEEETEPIPDDVR